MIVMGRVVAPFGIQGWLKVQPLGDDPLSWRRMPQWWVGRNPESTRSEDWQVFLPRGLRFHGKGLVAALAEVCDRTSAESLDGCFIAAPREALPPTAKDEYYWADLVGLSVLGREGAELGKVCGLLDTGAHSVLEVEQGEAIRLIPFVGAYVLDVDLVSQVIKVDWEVDW
ncbi:MAG: 16S rRNA processing protein RimM [Candidatus Dactylopiibacterium carminicum]|uniref:Ribosome maturation factor RimM n=1 Tax=Candidatus Dactylopiibacterium carminicum TaxID=857335 RepID=A0A272EX54_9RHOO|nr:ribosome maturation factor RimM [Candidatus Dactylopiibacterium carminicum]KAF7599583.1 ribosome maturation factor RimM [Candidatus Dactylopiibacterium carminicum]PAS94230.1 MAG: 16S rRNA processing protein RimM [Candidatus Dactylopiibacterium carminicum]PAS98427.1 MAG: 16S rRNA processing protein RimM [Candidatus Dactylopiibacterium carminicum]PAS99585.1 MAG: 16S rRNA processing protein RimM [Candidatus Dactylopiibacterium carminicum]